ncbi:MAG: circadian clock protein KaiC [Desulfohalobiaceae bacterium]|nr:circadian clock protein KaiC [Desulfohalobiaceae bacterium]
MTMETEEKAAEVEKAATGIRGLDEITRGGLPRGRSVLVSGGPGCGKTLLGLEFLYRGAAELDEPRVFICFEETALELIENVGSFGWDLRELIAEERFFIDHIRVESDEILETGTYDLDALFIRLMSAVQAVGARRIVLDTVESLFASLPNETLLRSELRRLFRWIKDQGLTAIITGESGEKSLTRHGLEEYVSDCVIELTRRTEEEVSTRRLQILKYRGASHETNSYPFLIDKSGFSILPITSAGLEHHVSEELVSTGIPDLDAMFGGKGFYRGSSALISGTAGTGKSSLAARFAQAACRRGERCLYFSLEEAGRQIIRNMRSIGIDRFFDHGYLDPAAQHREQRRAQPPPVSRQIQRPQALQPGQGVRPFRSGHPAGGHLPRPGRGAGRLGPAGPGEEGGP